MVLLRLQLRWLSSRFLWTFLSTPPGSQGAQLIYVYRHGDRLRGHEISS